MRVVSFLFGCLASGLLAGLSPAMAGSCPGNPSALGTSRTITVDPATMPRIGTVQYRNSLPLEEREVVLTFDDGPLAPYSTRILDALAAECVKVTYFLVGRMASADPALVRRIYNAGHSIGTHSQNHPLTFDQMDLPRIQREVSAGIASVQAAAGEPRAVAPFFRIPGLLRSQPVEHYLASKSIAVWSVDAVADDWYKQVTPEDIVTKAMSRLAEKGNRGILLLHDIHPATAMAVPMLLRELKAKGYRIVQAVPAGARPKSLPEAPALVADSGGGWPRVPKATVENTKVEKTAAELPRVEVSKSGRHALTERHERRPKQWRAARDPVITSAISRKRSQMRTTYSDAGWTRFAR
jgi:peptidoglycan/xylan/chitin deacetylase (PgdA/CDA1 family)